ncbi:MAG: hypothetical protein MI922_00685, partial [Bacteroidales bacterium]|nr:hypothetical protein [Bacteroidales bacterium]
TNTASFLDFIPFNGNVLNGINTGDNEEATNLVKEDWVSIEIRFGPGITQKAHRFYVPMEATSGVAASSYTYIDYVEVPFQVWDVTNNKQLMCSFRDQERDGKFNLYERASEDASAYGELGREYLFINSVEYDSLNPNANIAKTGGRSYKMIYFFWPTLAENGIWDTDNLPGSNLRIDYGYPVSRMGNLYNVADAYGYFGGPNGYDQGSGYGETVIPGFHPDHHELLPIPINETTGEFWILNSNDGGLGLSKDGGVTFKQIAKGLITTQFYHASKKPGAMEFIGGMQDNGTWQSTPGQNASRNSEYYFRYGGDGFGTIWNPKYDKLLLVSGYNNNIAYSKDGGLSFERKIGGIEIIEQNGSAILDGPFLTKLEIIPSKPDTVFAIGRTGLYYTYDFTRHDWKFKFMGNGWNEYDEATSNHQVKVSIADNSVIWAGAGMMGSDWRLFVSQNYGTSWSSVKAPSFSMPFLFSGFETHPTDKNTAYALYGAYGQPKILRTTDLGQTWEDISGVGNGFPDVACHSLFVFPNNTNRIWAGTEIGIFESMDNGATWNILNSDLPA